MTFYDCLAVHSNKYHRCQFVLVFDSSSLHGMVFFRAFSTFYLSTPLDFFSRLPTPFPPPSVFSTSLFRLAFACYSLGSLAFFSPFPSFTVSLTFHCFVSLYSFPRLHSTFYLLLLDFSPPSYYFPHLSFPVSLLSLYLVFVSPHFPRAVFAFSCSLFNSTKPIRSPFRTNSRKS